MKKGRERDTQRREREQTGWTGREEAEEDLIIRVRVGSHPVLPTMLHLPLLLNPSIKNPSIAKRFPPFPPAPYMCVFFNLYDFLSDVMIRTGFIQSDYCIFVLKISSLGFISAVYTLLFCFQAYVFFIHCWLLNLCYYHNW